MTITREQVSSALFTLLGAAYAFTAKGRRLRDPEDVPGTHRPALYLIEHDNAYHRPAPNLPPVRTLTFWAIVLTDDGGNQNVIPATAQNAILDAFDAALAPSPGEEFQTLGGLAYACLIDGAVERDAGNVNGKGVMAVPIHVILP